MIAVASALVFAAMQAHEAQEVQPFKAQEVQPFKAQEVQPYHAEPVKPPNPTGVDPVRVPVSFDTRLAGRWQISIPGVAWTTRTYEGPNAVDTTRSGPGASLGVLSVDARGRYIWRGTRGRLEAVNPRRDARPGVSYWRVRDGRQDYYAALEGERLVLYFVETNLFAAEGARLRGSRRLQ